MRSTTTDAPEIMSDSDFENVQLNDSLSEHGTSEFDDIPIQCVDCSQMFDWTAGEQAFYKAKQLENPPKRCKPCKIAKNRRLEAIEIARLTGKKHVIEVRADCARCGQSTTVPFYPSQGRPVYCRECFTDMKAQAANGSNA
ncbi:MAG: zinc-ribbon domain containing protein [Pyrinomonadaceae bacterium]|nr:zinc-ribbon domain containing protein [Pyrinomonadaceae bacterium]MBP9110774.1 zinc-ribbon domain containing protein [Pyrinomonadaceae bacterium]